MKRLYVALFVLFASFDASFAEDESQALDRARLKTIDLQDCNIMRIFQRLWKYSPLVERERAAWIVMNSKGEYESIDWLKTPERNITVWSEPLPENVVAQVHTHGDHLDPKPSKPDVNIARKLNIEVYILTRKGIWKAAPDGSITQQADRGWFKKAIEKCSIVIPDQIESAENVETLQITTNVRGFFYQLWIESGHGKEFQQREVAGWIIYGTNEYRCRKWPTSNERKKQVWIGSKPNDAVALAHTHPVNVDPKPSITDRSLAMKIGIPIYTISSKGIWKVNPDGVISQEEGSKWQRNLDMETASRCN